MYRNTHRGCQAKVRGAAGEGGELQSGCGVAPRIWLELIPVPHTMDVLTYGVRKEVAESMMFADDIALCGGKEEDMTRYIDT